MEDQEEDKSTISPADRIGRLRFDGPPPPMDDEDWIAVRSVEHDEGEGLITGEEVTFDNGGSSIYYFLMHNHLDEHDIRRYISDVL
ncbi:hypothetical protein QJS10_CPA01g01752 [Acorus calamus]|uniref:Uncharacterized protein n=1 Tax=Acorus calamus TaxID=4465 RepID=A0AAV9FGP3_ACOCL|nr:hypothetical protein QJS10_CPA01g01752 [Acorus calamus]